MAITWEIQGQMRWFKLQTAPNCKGYFLSRKYKVGWQTFKVSKYRYLVNLTLPLCLSTGGTSMTFWKYQVTDVTHLFEFATSDASTLTTLSLSSRTWVAVFGEWFRSCTSVTYRVCEAFVSQPGASSIPTKVRHAVNGPGWSALVRKSAACSFVLIGITSMTPSLCKSCT